MSLRSILFLILVCSCSSGTLLTGKYPVKEKVKIDSLKFIPQEKFQCGPAALAMVFQHTGVDIDEKKVSSMVFTPDKKGSFQSDMISSVRRERLLSLPVNTFKNLLMEVNAGNPVVVLQNLGLKWFPRWHYAVVVGYDLKKSEFILHSGTDAYLRTGFYTFKKTWERSDNWGLLVTKPGETPETVTEAELVRQIAQLEAMSFMKEAEKGYEGVLRKYPESLGALIGLGNIYFTLGDYSRSVKHLERATESHPQSPEAWHNLALALKAGRQMDKAKKAAQTAMALCGQNSLTAYAKNLKDLL